MESFLPDLLVTLGSHWMGNLDVQANLRYRVIISMDDMALTLKELLSKILNERGNAISSAHAIMSGVIIANNVTNSMQLRAVLMNPNGDA